MATSTTANVLPHSTFTPTNYRRSARSSICWPSWIAPPSRRRQAGSDRRVSGRGLGFGELTLPLTEGLLGAAAPPVSGNGVGPLRVNAAFLADVGPQIVHHGLGLAVDEDLHLTGQPGGFLDRRDQRRVVAREVFGHASGAAAAVDPSHLDTCRGTQFDLLFNNGDLEEHLANSVVWQGLQGGGNGGNEHLVAQPRVP